MSIINTLPLTLTNGTTADATQVMSLFAWIQSQTNGNACPATVGTSILKGDGAGGTTAAVAGTDYPPIASPTFTGSVTAPTFVGDITGNVSATTVSASGVMTAANGTTGNQVTNFSQFAAYLSNTGYFTLPSGIIIQFGQITSSGATLDNCVVNLPISFPNAPIRSFASLQNSVTGVVHEVWCGTLTVSTAKFTTLNSGSYSNGLAINWLVIGY